VAKTAASKGLQPLADAILNQTSTGKPVEAYAATFIDKGSLIAKLIIPLSNKWSQRNNYQMLVLCSTLFII